MSEMGEMGEMGPPLSPGTRSQLRLMEQLSFAAPGAALSPRQSLSDLMGSSRPPRRRAPPTSEAPAAEPEPAQRRRGAKPSAAGPPLEGADKENKKAGAKKKAGKKKADCSSPVDGFQMIASLAGPQAAPKGKGKGKGKKRARPKAPLPDAQRTGGGKRGSLLPQSEKARRKRYASHSPKPLPTLAKRLDCRADLCEWRAGKQRRCCRRASRGVARRPGRVTSWTRSGPR